MTPTLSVEAVHESVAALALTPLVARPVGVDGGVVSPLQAAVERGRSEAFVQWLPAAS